MSLLNRMLQDLDARQLEGRPLARLPSDVRPLPPLRPSRWPRLLVGGLVASLVGTAAVLFWPRAVLDTNAMPAAINRPIVAAAVEVPPPAIAVHPTDSRTEMAPLESLEGGSLRVSAAIPSVSVETPKGKAAEPPKSPAPVSPRRLGGERDISRVFAPEPLSGKVKPERNGDAPHAQTPHVIEKSDAAGSPRERANGEYRKAMAVLEQGRSGEAIDGLFSALRSDASHVAARQLLGKLLLESRRIDDAMQVLREGVQLLPGQSGWAMALARLQVERADLVGAAQTLEHALPTGGNVADYQGFLGHVLYRLGKHRESADHYWAATRLAPNDGRWWLGLGLSYDAEGRVTEAREALARAKATGTLSAALLAVLEQRLR